VAPGDVVRRPRRMKSVVAAGERVEEAVWLSDHDES
jgi:hypothetical protein